MNTNSPCPCCGVPLHVSPYLNGYIAWCGNGTCRSESANEGTEGQTVEKAIEKLNAAIAKEQE
jgi:hypothetical protein